MTGATQSAVACDEMRIEEVAERRGFHLELSSVRARRIQEELRIYDPYYCQGGVAKHLAKLGFTNVHNENEDFYARLDAGQVRLSLQLGLCRLSVVVAPLCTAATCSHVDPLQRTSAYTWHIWSKPGLTTLVAVRAALP